ncbi:MAG: glutamine synthetase family protein [Pseudomonadota bacterium]
MTETFADELAHFRRDNPRVEAAEVFVIDTNGIARGKLIPAEMLDKLAEGRMRLPTSTLALDIFGSDTEEAGVAIERGDPDGVLVPVPGSLAPLPWAERPTAQVQVQVLEPDGSPCPYDPRQVLSRVIDRAEDRGLTPVMALELEFYLIDADRPAPPAGPGGALVEAQIYEMEVIRAFDPILSEIAEAARTLGAPVETAIAEFGHGQFEINLCHGPDVLAAADDMVVLKRAIRGVARARGLDASFMPKPFGDMAGSGQHLHLSLLDDNGRNVLAGNEGASTPARHAIAGLLHAMPDCMLTFAPHANSYRRLAPGMYAPIVAAWGEDNRGVAVRMPETAGKGARIEHRTAGSDANPYLIAASVLAGALAGLEAKAEPPPPVASEAGTDHGPPLPLSWWAAEQAFSESAFVAEWLGPEFQHVYGAQKRSERAKLLARVPETELSLYLRRV